MRRRTIWGLLGTAVIGATGFWYEQQSQPPVSATTNSASDDPVVIKLPSDSPASLEIARDPAGCARKIAESANEGVFKISVEAMQQAIEAAAFARTQREERIRMRPQRLRNTDSLEEMRRLSMEFARSPFPPFGCSEYYGELNYLGDLLVDDFIQLINEVSDDHEQSAAASSNWNERKFDRMRLYEVTQALEEMGDSRALVPLKRLRTLIRNSRGQLESRSYYGSTLSVTHIDAVIERITSGAAGQSEWPAERRRFYRIRQGVGHIQGESFGDAEVEVAATFLRAEETDLRSDSIKALAMIGTPDAVRLLLQELHSADRTRRTTALDAIGATRSRWAVPILLALLNDESLYDSHKFDQRNSPEKLTLDLHPAHNRLRYVFEYTTGDKRPYWENQKCETGCFVYDVRKEKPLLDTWWQRNAKAYLHGDELGMTDKAPPTITIEVPCREE